MTEEQRRSLRKRAAEESPDSWEVVRKWIRQMVNKEPTVMREVAKATFGGLGNWIERGKDNVKVCGCLVGTVALKLVEARDHFEPEVNMGAFERQVERTDLPYGGGYVGETVFTSEVVAELARQHYANAANDAEDAGISASMLGENLGQDDAVALIKDEIHRQLRLRRKRLARRTK